MNIDLPFIPVAAIVSIIIFAAMRNKQAGRNDERRERLEQKYKELMDLLKRDNLPKENTNEHEN